MSVRQFCDNLKNDFYKVLAAPTTEKLLTLKNIDIVLDIACGNGLFSRSTPSKIKEVWAFDYSRSLVDFARAKTQKYANISFHILDATNEKD